MYNLNYNIFYNSMLALSRKRWPGQAWLIAWTHSFPRKLITECLVTKKRKWDGRGWTVLICGHVTSDLFMEIFDPLNFVSVARLGLVSNLVYNMHSPPTACCAFRDPQNPGAFPQVLHMTQWFWLNVFPQVSNIVFNHQQLRAGREGMAKIKNIIHAKLKARHLTSTQFVSTKMLKLFSIQLPILFPHVNLHIDLI